MSNRTREFFLNLFATLIGAAAGSYSAFWFERDSRQEERLEELVIAGYGAVAALDDMILELDSYRENIIDHATDFGDPVWAYMPTLINGNATSPFIDYQGMAPLYRDADSYVLRRVKGAEDALLTYRDALRMRTALLDRIRPSELAKALGYTRKLSEAELLNRVSPIDVDSLKATTDTIINQKQLRDFIAAVRSDLDAVIKKKATQLE